jgi:hypothetical protein
VYSVNILVTFAWLIWGFLAAVEWCTLFENLNSYSSVAGVSGVIAMSLAHYYLFLFLHWEIKYLSLLVF